MAPALSRTALARRRWDLQRFGITWRGAAARLVSPDAPKVLQISVPKAGTHLVERALCLHPSLHRPLTRTFFPQQAGELRRRLPRQRRGELLCAHLHHDPDLERAILDAGPRIVFVVRDPRDIVVSNAHYAVSPGHAWGPAARARGSERERVKLFIEGDADAGISGIGRVLELYAGWLDVPGVVIARYEDLVDPESRLGALTGLYKALGLREPERFAERVAPKLVSAASVTFRKGGSGGWREVFDAELEEAFQRSVGARAAPFGYS